MRGAVSCLQMEHSTALVSTADANEREAHDYNWNFPSLLLMCFSSRSLSRMENLYHDRYGKCTSQCCARPCMGGIVCGEVGGRRERGVCGALALRASIDTFNSLMSVVLLTVVVSSTS